jgi:hypothetical protein
LSLLLPAAAAAVAVARLYVQYPPLPLRPCVHFALLQNVLGRLTRRRTSSGPHCAASTGSGAGWTWQSTTRRTTT